MASRIDLVVVEDDLNTCKEYEAKTKASNDIFLISTTNNTKTALSLIKDYSPNAIILDLELHKGYGNGILFLKELSELNFSQTPYILVVTNNISSTTHDIVRNLGADFVITKNQQDYSVDMVLGFLVSILNSKAKLNNSSKAYELEKNQLNKEKLKERISKELDLIGVSPKVLGRKYLSDAIEIITGKRVHNISSILAQKYSKSDASIERAMQTAINRTWRNTDIDTLSKYYTAYISPDKGVPTVTEFIYYYAERIKQNI